MKHARGCACPRCRGWRDAKSLRQEAAAAVERRRERRKIKALALGMELAEGERRTEAYLRAEAERLERLRQDERLDALLASRGAGRPPGEAVAEVERRHGVLAVPPGVQRRLNLLEPPRRR